MIHIKKLLSFCSIVSFAINSYCAQVEAPCGLITKVEDLCKRIFAAENPSADEKSKLLNEICTLNTESNGTGHSELSQLRNLLLQRTANETRARFPSINEDIGVREGEKYKPDNTLFSIDQLPIFKQQPKGTELSVNSKVIPVPQNSGPIKTHLIPIDGSNEILLNCELTKCFDDPNLTNVYIKGYVYQRELKTPGTRPQKYRFETGTFIPKDKAFPRWISDDTDITNLAWSLINARREAAQAHKALVCDLDKLVLATQKTIFNHKMKRQPNLIPKPKAMQFATQLSQSKKELFYVNPTGLLFLHHNISPIRLANGTNT